MVRLRMRRYHTRGPEGWLDVALLPGGANRLTVPGELCVWCRGAMTRPFAARGGCVWDGSGRPRKMIFFSGVRTSRLVSWIARPRGHLCAGAVDTVTKEEGILAFLFLRELSRACGRGKPPGVC